MISGVVLIGFALWLNNGHYNPLALIAMLLTLVATVVVVLRSSVVVGVPQRVLMLAVLVQWLLMLTRPPGIYLLPGTSLQPFQIGVIALAGLTIVQLSKSAQIARVGFIGILTIYALLGGWLIQASPGPWIDVWSHQQAACDALLLGENPYRAQFNDIYGDNSPFYSPGMSENGKLTFGIAYPPMSLMLALPGYLVGGDVRYSLLGAMLLAAWVISRFSSNVSDRISTLAGLLYLSSPNQFFMLEQAWTESFLVLLLAMTLCVANRRMKQVWQVLTLGLFIACKQYVVLFLPLFWLIAPTKSRFARLAVSALGVAILCTLPLAVWDWSSFIQSTIMTHFNSPFRADALTVNAWLFRTFDMQLPKWISFVVLWPAIAWVVCKSARRPAGLAIGIAAVSLVFFIFSKQAFLNYYTFTVGALCCAIALTESDSSSHRPSTATV